MMILNQVTRAFTSRKKRTSTLFRRPKTASTIIIDNEVENSKDDCLSLVKKNHTGDDDDIVSTTSNSSATIDLTPCSSARCVIITTNSSKSMKRTDIDMNRIPLVPTLLKSDNDDKKDNAEHNILNTIPSLRRSTSIADDHEFDNTILCSYDDDNDDDESDSDCDDSCIFAPPPVPFVCVPTNFTHADALLQTTQNSNCDIPNNILLLNRPPTRIGDWDAHTIESNNPEDDELSDTHTHTSKRSAAEAAGTNTLSSMTMHILAGRRHHQARRRHHQARAVLSQNVRQLSSTSIRYSNNNNSKDTQTQQRSASIRNDDGKQQQQQQHQQHQQHQHQQDKEDERQQPPQRQPRVVKWNMIR